MEELILRLNELGYTVSIKERAKENITIIEIFANNTTRSEAIKNKSIKVYFLKHSSKKIQNLVKKILNFYISIVSKHINPFKIHVIDFINILCLKSYGKYCHNYNKKDYPKIIIFIIVVTVVFMSALLGAYYRIKLDHMFF